MTVAQLRPAGSGDDVEVMFLESSRIYSVRTSDDAHQHMLDVLRDALTSRRRVSVTLSSINGGEITDVQLD